MFRITKTFISGLLAGITIVEIVTFEIKVGFRCENPIGGSGYVVESVERI